MYYRHEFFMALSSFLFILFTFFLGVSKLIDRSLKLSPVLILQCRMVVMECRCLFPYASCKHQILASTSMYQPDYTTIVQESVLCWHRPPRLRRLSRCGHSETLHELPNVSQNLGLQLRKSKALQCCRKLQITCAAITYHGLLQQNVAFQIGNKQVQLLNHGESSTLGVSTSIAQNMCSQTLMV